MKKNSNKQYAQALYEVTKDLNGSDLTQAIKVFIAMLVRDHALKKSERIIAEFEKYTKQQQGVVDVEVISARKLDTTTLEQIKKVFSAQGGSASSGGDNVNATTTIDETMIGGLKIRMEDKILDGSVKTQLNLLKHKLL